MLTKNQKKEIIEKLTKEIAESKTVVICDFKGLNVADLGEIRKKLKENESKMKVAKKTLAQLAFKEAGIEMNTEAMEGQLAFIYGGKSEVAAPKVLAEFAKKNEALKILAGALEGEMINAEKIMELSKIPSREDLLARIVGTINAPVSGFVRVLSGNLRSLVLALNAIKETK